MNTGKTVFAQLMEHVPKYEFGKCVDRYGGEIRVRKFSCWDQFCCTEPVNDFGTLDERI